MRSIHGPMYVVDGIIKSVQRMKLKVEKDSFWESDKGQKLLTVVPPDAKDLEKQLLKGVPDAFKCMSVLKGV